MVSNGVLPSGWLDEGHCRSTLCWCTFCIVGEANRWVSGEKFFVWASDSMERSISSGTFLALIWCMYLSADHSPELLLSNIIKYFFVVSNPTIPESCLSNVDQWVFCGARITDQGSGTYSERHRGLQGWTKKIIKPKWSDRFSKITFQTPRSNFLTWRFSSWK